MRTRILSFGLSAGMMAAVLGAAPAWAHEPCNCLGGYFERPFTSDRAWRRAPTHYYRLVHHRPTYRYVVLARPCRDCRHPR
jgi:hypothetical protein